MAIIDSDGLFNGDRFTMVSDSARYAWPYMWCASNTLGRLELNYHTVMGRAFHRFKVPPTEEQFWIWVDEFAKAYLLFVYQSADAGQWWGQWYTEDQYLQTYKLSKDTRTPAPNPKLFQAWKREYITLKNSRSAGRPSGPSASTIAGPVDALRVPAADAEDAPRIALAAPIPIRDANRLGFVDPAINFDFQTWFDRRYERHPKKGNLERARDLIREVIDMGVATPQEFEEGHELWCESENWTDGGGKFVKQDLAQWTLDKGWLFPPSVQPAKANNASPREQTLQRARDRQKDRRF